MAHVHGEDRLVLNEHIKKVYARFSYPEEWRNLPEVPDREEILPIRPVEDESYDVNKYYGSRLPVNIFNGPWPSEEAYLGAHYQILREDAIGALRDSVAAFKENPQMMDANDTCIYTDVHFKGVFASNRSVSFRVEFSYERAGKRIRWEQSKRLQQGSLVALSPQRDCFQTLCKMAVIEARPIKGGLDQNPPTVDITWGSPDEVEFKPGEPYVMIESRSGYFEASRHMLVALQKLMTEKFPLRGHIVQLRRNIEAPDFVEKSPFLNLSSLLQTTAQRVEEDSEDDKRYDGSSLHQVCILKDNFPTISNTGLDDSQIAALRRMLSKQLAIIQGPPGTGKTFVSVAALTIMLKNWTEGDPPIIIAAQTNHAVDQLLNHLAAHEDNFARLGGRSSKEHVQIQERTMYNLRIKTPITGSGEFKTASDQIRIRTIELESVLGAILVEDPILDLKMLERKVLTQEQYDSLHDSDWISADDDWAPTSSLHAWVGKQNLVPISQTPPINMGFEEEELDLEFEQLQELELENENGDGQEENDAEALRGNWIPFGQKVTGRHVSGWSAKKTAKLLSKCQNLWKIPTDLRGEVFRSLLDSLYTKMREELQQKMILYQKDVENLKIAREITNLKVIRKAGIKLIGCTTTGLSKYRAFLAALKPRTLLIEEAAETLEGSVTAALLDSLEQLILVGDHKQLEAHCNNSILQKHPYNLGKSMFERLVNNSIEYTMLNRQRRMITDIRKLLSIDEHPFYQDLHDHEYVLDRTVNRPHVEGMGGIDTFFFNHNWPESRDNDASRYNTYEAEMVVGAFNYLVLNGIHHSKITVLTFYNGQRKQILRQIRQHPNLRKHVYFNVYTVDSYQGEENDIILLSLVRSNDYMSIGFLDNENRLVVALSRARRGLYIFGNSVTLASTEAGKPIWDPIFKSMGRDGRYSGCTQEGRAVYGFPVTCSKHHRQIQIFQADEWEMVRGGGCDLDCDGELPCGHPCPTKCHPYDHDIIICTKPCVSILECGHGCSEYCGLDCRCEGCEVRQIEERHLEYNRWPGEAYVRRPNSSEVEVPEDSTGSWEDWNAEKHDAEMDEQLRRQFEAMPKPSTVVFNETYIPEVVDDKGRKVVGKPEHRVVFD
ncbi:hypothetical protein BP5796_09517 [Coleophoma crateriformis]|uniref:Uncharacterized protein n=1 Tax=Coleophoma crateriformis TaxID=565419 RepID=A0A3D8QYK9_9HELO|nr:hypothetical protein BP5796_09517 [Coleophoma crateriformis]